MSEQRRPREDWVHVFFQLTYANYLVLNRALLQSMPDDWQARFVGCLHELNAAFPSDMRADGFMVKATDFAGKFVVDPCPHYERGRTFIPPDIEAMATARERHETEVAATRQRWASCDEANKQQALADGAQAPADNGV